MESLFLKGRLSSSSLILDKLVIGITELDYLDLNHLQAVTNNVTA